MTTSLADIRTAWNAKVWTNASITALTDKIYAYDITKDSGLELSMLWKTATQQINFFTYVANRAQQLGISNQRTLLFTVEVAYHVEQFSSATAGTLATNNEASVIDGIVAVDDLVFSALRPDWNGTVLYFEPQSGPCKIAPITIDGRPVYRATYTYTGYVRDQLS